MPIDFIPQVGDPELVALGIHSNDYRADYERISADLKMYARQDNRDEFLRVVHHMAKVDLFFLCYFVLDLPVNHPFLLARINEVQDKSHMTVDLWAREHWKSTILTFALTIYELINNKEERICIFSHTRSLAKSHLRRIKQALESNELLLEAFPDVFYRNPQSDAPKWSEDDGLYVKRFKTYNEASLEAWGLIDGMPTGKHYTKRIYDDIITEKSVNTPAQVQKATEMFRLSENLGARGGQKRVIGTRYSHKDTYEEIMKNHRWKVRLFPAEVDEKGKFKIGGKPVYITRDELNNKFDEMGEYIYSAQMGQDPRTRSNQQFIVNYLRFWDRPDQVPRRCNKYLIIDPASEKKKSSDTTVMQVWKVDSMRNYWLVDIIRDRMNLGQRWEKMRDLVFKHNITNPVGYEKYGKDSDIEYFKMQQEEHCVYFPIEPLKGNIPKWTRIMNLLPLLQKQRIYLPRTAVYTDIEGKYHDLTGEFLYDEYTIFPFSRHDDMLDCMARLLDPAMNIIFPSGSYVETEEEKRTSKPFDTSSDETGTTWMSE
jgi:phage terminase large subunit-like protein